MGNWEEDKEEEEKEVGTSRGQGGGVVAVVVGVDIGAVAKKDVAGWVAVVQTRGGEEGGGIRAAVADVAFLVFPRFLFVVVFFLFFLLLLLFFLVLFHTPRRTPCLPGHVCSCGGIAVISWED